MLYWAANKAQSQLGSLNTVADVKKNAKTIRHMQTYAKKSGNAELIEYTTACQNTHNHLTSNIRSHIDLTAL